MAKSKSKATSDKAPLAKELRSLIPKLDSEGLAFLVEQARIHLYNMQVDELNKAAEAANAASSRKGTIAKAGQSKADGFRIDGTDSGSSYYLYYRNGSVMLSRDEMIQLVKIVNANRSELENRELLYNWLARERKDIFALIPIKDQFDERLKILLRYIKKSFMLR